MEFLKCLALVMVLLFANGCSARPGLLRDLATGHGGSLLDPLGIFSKSKGTHASSSAQSLGSSLSLGPLSFSGGLSSSSASASVDGDGLATANSKASAQAGAYGGYAASNSNSEASANVGAPVGGSYHPAIQGPNVGYNNPFLSGSSGSNANAIATANSHSNDHSYINSPSYVKGTGYYPGGQSAVPSVPIGAHNPFLGGISNSESNSNAVANANANAKAVSHGQIGTQNPFLNTGSSQNTGIYANNNEQGVVPSGLGTIFGGHQAGSSSGASASAINPILGANNAQKDIPATYPGQDSGSGYIGSDFGTYGASQGGHKIPFSGSLGSGTSNGGASISTGYMANADASANIGGSTGGTSDILGGYHPAIKESPVAGPGVTLGGSSEGSHVGGSYGGGVSGSGSKYGGSSSGFGGAVDSYGTPVKGISSFEGSVPNFGGSGAGSSRVTANANSAANAENNGVVLGGYGGQSGGAESNGRYGSHKDSFGTQSNGLSGLNLGRDSSGASANSAAIGNSGYDFGGQSDHEFGSGGLSFGTGVGGQSDANGDSGANGQGPRRDSQASASASANTNVEASTGFSNAISDTNSSAFSHGGTSGASANSSSKSSAFVHGGGSASANAQASSNVSQGSYGTNLASKSSASSHATADTRDMLIFSN